MKPHPFSSLNHFTFPTAIGIPPLLLSADRPNVTAGQPPRPTRACHGERKLCIFPRLARDAGVPAPVGATYARGLGSPRSSRQFLNPTAAWTARHTPYAARQTLRANEGLALVSCARVRRFLSRSPGACERRSRHER